MNSNKDAYLKVNNRYYIMYYSLLLYLLGHSLAFYNNNGQSKILIVGMVLEFTLLVLSLLIFLVSFHCILSNSGLRISFILLYLITGLFIIFSEPEILVFIDSSVKNPFFHSFFTLSMYINLGSRVFFAKRFWFYVCSYIIIALHTAICFVASDDKPEIAISSVLLCVQVHFKAGDIKKLSKNYKIILTETEQLVSPYEEAKTPLDEIIIEIKQIMEKFNAVSKEFSPYVKTTYKEIKNIFEDILKKLQSNNIYSPRLDLVTKNMDLENKIFIEQEFFESKASSLLSPPDHIHPKSVIEYSISELLGILKPIGNEWNYNTFFIGECSRAPIKVIGEYIIKLYRLEETFKFSDDKMMNFLSKLEDSYYNNPYHNSCHAADVLCSFIYLLSNSIVKKYMNSLEWLGSIIACLAHDVRHPAKNNRYLIMTQNEYAITYNDISVLENMHSATVFGFLQISNCNLLSEMGSEKYQQIRKLIIDMILATDMGKHFDLVSYMKNKYSENVDFNNWDTRQDLFRFFIKASDVGHAAKSLELHQKWCSLVIEEFFAQGDLEKSKGIPVSMFCDRENTNINKSQAGFIKNIVLSLYETLNLIVNSEEIDNNCVKQLKNNLKYWETANCPWVHGSTERNEDGLIYLKSSRKGSLP
ncbi:hypothetical protein SteCoe_15239 [Stentor coeruleus]|uniref:Phosphodiesterase n=1 Tax=Stentor coeruleus TaxID=5963 RepID=A0A1R2C464_9CILI|nr:hypothetical protein SteCoe_15239 [Stentor coeruleus]